MALNFPAKIYLILENESTDVIRWHANGRAFRILDHNRFEREVIPKYFRHNQLSSVQRQLNLYGFKCVNRGEDKGAFYHPQFKRGSWDAVKKITRYTPARKSDFSFFDQAPEFIDGSDRAVTYSNSDLPSTQVSSNGVQTGSQVTDFPLYPTKLNSWCEFDGFQIMDYGAAGHMTSQFGLFPYSSNLMSVSTGTGSDFNACSVDETTSSGSSQGAAEMKAELNEQMDKSFVNVVNNVVLVDPDFDLDMEFDMFPIRGISNHVVGNKLPASTRDIGVNTELTFTEFSAV